MNLKKIKFVLIVFLLSCVFLSFKVVLAQDYWGDSESDYPSYQDRLYYQDYDGVMKGAGITKVDRNVGFGYVIGGIIQAFIGILGIALIILLVYAGYLWATAGGNTEEVKKSKQMMVNGLVGIILMLSAYAITDYVLNVTVGKEAQKTETEIDNYISNIEEVQQDQDNQTIDVTSGSYWWGENADLDFEGDAGIWDTKDVGKKILNSIGGFFTGLWDGVTGKTANDKK